MKIYKCKAKPFGKRKAFGIITLCSKEPVLYTAGGPTVIHLPFGWNVEFPSKAKREALKEVKQIAKIVANLNRRGHGYAAWVLLSRGCIDESTFSNGERRRFRYSRHEGGDWKKCERI